MKISLAILVILALGMGALFASGVFDEPPPLPRATGAEPPRIPRPGKDSAGRTEPRDDTMEAESRAESSEDPLRVPPKIRALWRALRPEAESLVPDPDHVGPCPPPSEGGHPARVIRRFKDPKDGFYVWVHEDGAETRLYLTAPLNVDPKTGKPKRQLMVGTFVPTTPVPISPEDLEGGPGTNKAGDGGTSASDGGKAKGGGN